MARLGSLFCILLAIDHLKLMKSSFDSSPTLLLLLLLCTVCDFVADICGRDLSLRAEGCVYSCLNFLRSLEFSSSNIFYYPIIFTVAGGGDTGVVVLFLTGARVTRFLSSGI